jgi:hypothetical protein
MKYSRFLLYPTDIKAWYLSTRAVADSYATNPHVVSQSPAIAERASAINAGEMTLLKGLRKRSN